MPQLSQILENLEIIHRQGSEHISIGNIQSDSRLIKKGDLFFARKHRSDGREFIHHAIERGAVAVICGPPLVDNLPPHVTLLMVEDPNVALGIAASNLYGSPSRALALIGVTGTNGKTTIATALFRLFRKLGHKAGLLSTIQNQIEDEVVVSTHTTPDVLQNHNLMRRMVDAGCRYCFMEVSSHGMVQRRIEGLRFAGGIFTNLTRDHLDYHETFDRYREAKKAFFDYLPSDAFALVNADDPNAEFMLRDCRARTFHYGIRTPADFRCQVLKSHFDGMRLQLDGVTMDTGLVGEFNAANLVAVHGAAILLRQSKNQVLAAIGQLGGIPGRFQSIPTGRGATAIIDYAHTPDALENVLNTIDHIRDKNQRIITVVGAGGDRDKTKRPLMGKIAGQWSDMVILTADNPRSEDPARILDHMQQGVETEDRKKVTQILDRREAMETALSLANRGDIVLVAGKGHETYQEINGIRHHFDDSEVVRAFSDRETQRGDK
uniref:UDP-N-acetylmuramoyl-L-alanyl-D-glutamate--2,6-diaminopimelate ligase n=1 Tax=Candidatus Kentrum sp. MB TaxID=2138164 RepID=A0A450XF05_9GAMM|nr:MAG: UDP-N-acetylmuramoylalanyl-D-glutamate--2,6-diaminopimelate ligase [Candidatus Kentron sp. MB]VFK27877.1 MAG: UDP-N-acetylmuramoylalanyl-D-glutamate--2,6-diaminopimelate ligase [Candidatus Kentron sp. MB]VFK74449.1 MAG: UDP-N-acetylmuramoylalanyl-D-glutamate--2,6-diaminopimelate ligase [Candidatus Kentron sp. MB]